MVQAKMCFFFFNDTATTEIYTLSLHDALPIWLGRHQHEVRPLQRLERQRRGAAGQVDQHDIPLPFRLPHRLEHLPFPDIDRKSTRLNSSHANISYAVFCLKKKTNHS